MIKNERCIPVLPNLPLPNLDDSSPENIAKCDLVFDMIYDKMVVLGIVEKTYLK